MELVAEYADRYKHTPPPETTWHEFVALLERVDRFDLRDRLRIRDGQLLSGPVDPSHARIAVLEADRMNRLAYPGKG